jgi:hypothetical protein
MGFEMNQKRTPQEKKILNYVNQTKNSYGENDKSSRKAIRNRKAAVNRDHRRVGRSILRQTDSDWDLLDSRLSETQRKKWVKVPDESLIEHLYRAWSDSSRTKKKELNGKLQKEAIKRLKQMNRDARNL